MFTKYTGIELPQNYSGSRFKQDIAEDTEMKTHRGQISTVGGVVKSSVSPSFQSIIDNAVADNQATEDFSDAVSHESEEIECNPTVECNTVDTVSGATEKTTVEATLKRFLDTIGKDEMLLLSLLLLFASDNQECSLDGIIIIALLLLYR